ncbi:MAG: sigma-54 dependent transcriptional regulator [Bacteroidales bacterium]|jgi:DNA-binding NtrC family response regulator|nr:sigma-54 dependent transcriptional regulator [Bacteroidales bacterium]
MTTPNINAIKQRFGIIGFDKALENAIHVAVQVAHTDLSVLITGESGVGKENFPKIIHEYSARKHGPYIAVNCGAIPEGTIDSELFGHEKGAFTNAIESRKGYFEVANKGTIFLDEVADLPLSTQVRLLRVLENGEFIKVGSSTVQTTSVRVVAATNADMISRIANGKFREDLYYRLNSVPIHVPPLRDRQEDILLLFTKFAMDFADTYKFPVIELLPDAIETLNKYRWPGNIRQLKNITEQISLLETQREISAEILSRYLTPFQRSNLPILAHKRSEKIEGFEMELLLSLVKDMRRELDELKLVMHKMLLRYPLSSEELYSIPSDSEEIEIDEPKMHIIKENKDTFETPIIIDDNFSLSNNEKDLIIKALERHEGNRKEAAEQLGISERTLYRKIKEFGL